MQLNWQQWNRKAQTFMLILTLIGIIAAIPLGISRWGMEQSANKVEFVYDYRDLVQIASYQARPQEFIQEQLGKMKEAGIQSMAVFESSLDELSWAGRLSVYNSAALNGINGKLAPVNENFTYVIFAGSREESELRPLIESTYEKWGIAVRPFTADNGSGLVLETPYEDAKLKLMSPDPIALQMIRDADLGILPRLSDRVPYDVESVDRLIADYKELGVKRILFDGNAVKGFADNEEKKSLYTFADILNKHGIGVAAIENSKPQKGMGTLGYLLDYNVARIYSLSDIDAAGMKANEIADRFQLAVKDRNIRMFYLNGAPMSDSAKSSITYSLDNIYEALNGKDGAIAKIEKWGFSAGTAEAFDSSTELTAWQKALKGLVALGAIALIVLLVAAFVSGVNIPVFVIGLIGSAGLNVLSPSILEQGLALGAAISAPTLALIWAINRVRAHTVGNRRAVGANVETAANVGGRWIFPGLSAGRRFKMAIALFAATSIISLAGVPFVFGLLNSIKYSLVLDQFRGVGLLHMAPIGLTALYVFLYTGDSVLGNLRKLLMMPITVLWVVGGLILGAAGMYYLSRTGNEGQVTGVEMIIRNLLETTIGVRPRFKEFMLSHPLFLFGLFLALRYRAAWVLFIVAAIGQLSIVDTFAHIHTPLAISLIRVSLGLAIGALFGLVLIAVWQVGEGVWRRWGAPRLEGIKQQFKAGA
ncbi:hypothetical protein PAECIP111893_00391 [Paenibacillus plantiphilus]|uniref:Uncharacterized protein n=2 Tax=Paenibacillus plantiphilus TaxID=2905650 RepID=A0ABM9BRX6_9BACL|nr:DUF5693 family protein [Paenibacillus plantiphilus]CAH1193138.1 hypothetical protein PAECIP111893_00391 [Paenibacillus plantiphilus]